MNYRVVSERIKTEKVYPVGFQRKFNGKIDYFQACFAQISEDTDDFVLGFKLVNDIVEHEKERNDRLVEEKQILEDMTWEGLSIKEIQKHLPNRSIEAIRKQIYRMNTEGGKNNE